MSRTLTAQTPAFGEGRLFALIAKRFAWPKWATFAGVRNATGFNATREADAISMAMYASSGLLLAGFEIKSFRSDWLRELQHPGKTDETYRFCDLRYLVASPGVAKVEELPEGWGLMEPTSGGDKLRVLRPSVRREAAPVTRDYLAVLIQRAHAPLHEAAKELAMAEGRRCVEQEAAFRAEQLKRRESSVADDMAFLDKVKAAAGPTLWGDEQLLRGIAASVSYQQAKHEMDSHCRKMRDWAELLGRMAAEIERAAKPESSAKEAVP